MYPLHPATVHLPIGLLIGSAILTALYLRRGEPTLETAAYHCLWLGWLCGLPAVASGVYTAIQQFTGEQARVDALGWVNAHAAAALTVLVVYWIAWQRRRRNPAILEDAHLRRGYLALHAVGVALILLTGWLGGHMVYVLRIGVAG